MLKVAIDDPAAGEWTIADIARRVLGTALALAVLAGAAAFAIANGWAHLLWAVPVGLALAFWFVTAPPEQTAEVGADGASRTLWVCRRGRYCWFSSHVEVALEDERRVVRLRGGLVAPDGLHRPELGLDLWEGEYGDSPLRAMAPRFAVAGISAPGPTPILEALAVEVARTLDAPVRGTSE